jgi:hypothetical protein
MHTKMLYQGAALTMLHGLSFQAIINGSEIKIDLDLLNS